MRQLLLALANWIGVLDFLKRIGWNHCKAILYRSADVLVFDSEGRTGMLYSIVL